MCIGEVGADEVEAGGGDGGGGDVEPGGIASDAVGEGIADVGAGADFDAVDACGGGWHRCMIRGARRRPIAQIGWLTLPA